MYCGVGSVSLLLSDFNLIADLISHGRLIKVVSSIFVIWDRLSILLVNILYLASLFTWKIRPLTAAMGEWKQHWAWAWVSKGKHGGLISWSTRRCMSKRKISSSPLLDSLLLSIPVLWRMVNSSMNEDSGVYYNLMRWETIIYSVMWVDCTCQQPELLKKSVFDWSSCKSQYIYTWKEKNLIIESLLG